ncbi:MAG: hypothetical protein HKN50_02545 [Gammaproteobacteria bacterium]|nr:hypothetical protein [Gammaproteobacteria bacterium]
MHPSDTETEQQASRSAIDWRVMMGIILTSVWIMTGLIYLLGIVGWAEFVALPTADIGSFLEGAFAPLAFLWLVIGHFMQQTEISANTRAIMIQEQSAKRQELHSRRDSYFKLLGLIQDQLGAIAGFHYMSVCGPTGTGEMSTEEFANLRGEAAAGDASIFTRKMISLLSQYREDPQQVEEILFGTEIRTRHSNNFVDTFAKLLRNAESVDHDDMVVNAVLFGSPSGMYYRIIRAAQGKEELNPLTGFATRQTKN